MNATKKVRICLKTLILYATKYGAAREIAERVSGALGGAELFDLKQDNIPDLREYECVIIGSSVYAGSIRKEAKLFLAKKANSLSDKQIGLFISGMSKNEAENEKMFTNNFPEAILSTAKAKSLLGGVFDPQKAGGFERFVMKIVTKQKNLVNTIDEEKIKRFAAAFVKTSE